MSRRAPIPAVGDAAADHEAGVHGAFAAAVTRLTELGQTLAPTSTRIERDKEGYIVHINVNVSLDNVEEYFMAVKMKERVKQVLGVSRRPLMPVHNINNTKMLPNSNRPAARLNGSPLPIVACNVCIGFHRFVAIAAWTGAACYPPGGGGAWKPIFPLRYQIDRGGPLTSTV